MENHSQLKAFILCGGQGTRLASVVENRPKALAIIGGQSFLLYLISFLNKAGVKDLVFLTGHMGQMIKSELGEGFHYSEEKTPLGTGGALLQALEDFPGKFSLVLNGDSLFLIDLKVFIQKALVLFKEKPELQVVLALKNLPSAERYGVVQIDSQNLVTSFQEKSVGAAFINAGIYLVRDELKRNIGPGFVSLEKEVFFKLIGQKKMAGVELEGEFLDIGTPDDFERAQTLIPSWMARV